MSLYPQNLLILPISSSLRYNNSCFKAADDRVIKMVFSLKEISEVFFAIISPAISFQLFLTVNREIFTSRCSSLRIWEMASPNLMRFDFFAKIVYKYFFGLGFFRFSEASITLSFKPALKAIIFFKTSLSDAPMICAAKMPAFCAALTATVATGTPLGI